MTISKVENLELSLFLGDLTRVVNFNEDLPGNVFKGEMRFWFFERPLLAYLDIFSGLVSTSVACFESEVYIKFSGRELLSGSCFSLDGREVSRDVEWLSRSFESFFEGQVGYPIIFCDKKFRWVAYESAYEEFGVIAVKESLFEMGFHDYLSSNFISVSELGSLASGASIENMIAKALIASYS